MTHNFAYRGPGEDLASLDGAHVWNCASWNRGQSCSCPISEPEPRPSTAELLDRIDADEAEEPT